MAQANQVEQSDIMNTPIDNRNLTQQPPNSPRQRFGGFALLARTVDKCRASITRTLGEYHYNCPLDNMLFEFKGITGDQFKIAVVSARNYEDVAAWLQSNGAPKTSAEIEAWSDKVETLKLKDVAARQGPNRQPEVIESCRQLGLQFETVSLCDWLEADDAASFQLCPELAEK
jgi:hypothetical protein